MRKLLVAAALLAAACRTPAPQSPVVGEGDAHAADAISADARRNTPVPQAPEEKRAYAFGTIPADALRHTPTPRFPPPIEKGAAREKWLFEQRAYPFGTIPADARRNAFRMTQRMRIASDAVETDAVASRWRAIGPLPVLVDWPWVAATGRVKALAVSPVNPDVVLAGSSSGGIWRSTNAGRTFAPVSDDHADLAVGAIAFAPSNPNIVYATMGSDFLGTGVLRSDDAGANWRHVSGATFGERGATPYLVLHPSDPNHLWAAQYARVHATGSLVSSGVLESTDGGVTWTRRFAGLPTSLVAMPGSATRFLAGMLRVDDGSGRAPGIYRSTDAGHTWTQVYTFGGHDAHPRIGVTPAAPQRAYAYVFGGSDTGVRNAFLVTNDAGATWTATPALGLPLDYAVFVQVDPSNANVVYVGMRDLYRSLDGGQTFTNVTKGYTATDEFDPAGSTAHVDQHSMAFHPSDASTLYLGNDGGVFLSHDRGTTYESLSGTLSLVQAYGIAAHPTDPAALYLGTQDNGLERRYADGSWRELITGDYGSIVFDNDDPSLFLSNYVFANLLVFRDDRYLGPAVTDDTFGPGPVGFIAPFEHLRSSNALYFGTWRLYRSADFGRTWTTPAGDLDLTKGNGDTLSVIAVSDDRIYTGSTFGRVMLSRDDGFTWTDVTAGLPDRSVRAIVIDGDTAYAGFSGYATEHVFVTRDGGASWQPMSAGLPDIPVSALLQRGAYLYAGTDIGVFRWDGTRWTYFSSGMPPVIVTDFAVTADGRIVAATHGRGAYELVAPATRRRGVRH